MANTPPDTVKKVAFCAASGELPNPWCPKLVDGWYIPGVSPIKVSNLHRPVWLDNKTGAAVCPPYDSAIHHQEVFAFWPSDLAALFEQAGLPRRMPPELPAACSQRVAVSYSAPLIRSPLKGVTYSLRQSVANEHIALKADAASDSQILYWFAGNSLLGQSLPGQTLEWRPPRAGRFQLSVSDEKGRSASRLLRVDMLP
ncbi:hypothetical protein ACWAU3_21365 [Shewanella sp. JL219SE-S6]